MALYALSAAAILAYLDAKLSIFHDCFTDSALLAALRVTPHAESTGRVNAFPVLEKRARATKTANATFLSFEKREWTYHSAYVTVLQYGQWLKLTHGVAPGETVAMDMTNKPEFIWMCFSLWSLGAKPAFINHNPREDALVHCVRLSRARLLIVDEDVQEARTNGVRAQLQSLDGLRVSMAVLTSSCQDDVGLMETARQPDADRSGDKLPDMTCLTYTSGTNKSSHH